MVIDTLTVQLGLDPSKFTQGQKDAIAALRAMEGEAKKSASRTETEAKRVSNTMQNLQREALNTFGLFVGGAGLAGVINQITKLDASTGRLAVTLGVTTEEASAWQGVFKQMGGTTEGANAALAGLNGELTKFVLTGDSSALGIFNALNVSIYDANNKLKTSSQLMLDLAESVKGMEPREAAAKLSMVPGMSPEAINVLLKGRAAVEGMLETQRKAGVATKESSDQAQKFQTSISLLGDSATNAARALLGDFYPALTKIADKLRELIELSPKTAGVLGLLGGYLGFSALKNGAMRLLGRTPGPGVAARLAGGVGAAGVGGTAALAGAFLLASTQPAGETGAYDPVTNPGGKRGTAGGAAGVPSRLEQEEYIRRAAIARGIDPNVAVAVAASEGLKGKNWKADGSEESYGPFQLHYGGRGQTGGLARKGLGDAFTAATGLDAADPAHWRPGVDFALDEAAKKGWGQWYGWKGDKYAGIGGARMVAAGAGGGAGAGQAGNRSVTTTIQSVQVNAPNATDAEGIAREFGPQLDRVITAGFANEGLE